MARMLDALRQDAAARDRRAAGVGVRGLARRERPDGAVQGRHRQGRAELPDLPARRRERAARRRCACGRAAPSRRRRRTSRSAAEPLQGRARRKPPGTRPAPAVDAQVQKLATDFLTLAMATVGPDARAGCGQAEPVVRGREFPAFVEGRQGRQLECVRFWRPCANLATFARSWRPCTAKLGDLGQKMATLPLHSGVLDNIFWRPSSTEWRP